MPNQYTVKAGDTVDAIAKRFGTTRENVSGFRSNDPNVILPGELLTINPPAQQSLLRQNTQTTVPLMSLGSQQVNPNLKSPNALPAPVQQPVAQQATVQAPAQPAPTRPPTQAQPIAQETQQPVVAEPTPEQNFFSQFGVSTDALSQGFQTNPSATLSSLVQQVMQATGLPDVRENVSKIAGEIEDLANQRDEERQKIQDNPWKSASTKASEIQRLEDKYENKIANRTNRLTLLQKTYDDARQQAQFAATTAIGLYDKQRTFDFNTMKDFLDREEKAAEAMRGDFQSITLKDEFGNDYVKVFDKKTGEFKNAGFGGDGSVSLGGGSGGGGSSPGSTKTEVQGLVQVGTMLASSFPNKFQQTQFLKTLKDLSAQGDTQGLSEHIFSRAIDTMADSDERKKVRGRYEMVKRLNRIQDLLVSYEAKGGDTGFFRGNTQNIKEKFGKVGDKELATIGTAIASALDELVRFRTGAALTESEEKFYKRLLPGIIKSAALNEANITGLRDSLAFDVDNAMRLQLTSDGYSQVQEGLSGSPVSQATQETKNFNGVPYRKVPGGWEKIK